MWDQEIRKETSAKTISTSEVIGKGELNTSIKWIKWYTIVMINKPIP